MRNPGAPPRARRLVALLAGCTVAGLAAATGPTIQLVERDQMTLEIRVLSAELLDPEPGGGLSFEVDDTSPTEVELRVLWPDPNSPSRLRLRAKRGLTSSGHLVRIESELRRPGETAPVRAAREIIFSSETTTALFEVARHENRVLTLALKGELTRVTDYNPRPVVGAPVLFHLDIEWVNEGDAQNLESNRLNTFVGQSVGYSFQLGETGEAESLSIRLLPIQLVGETVRLEVEVSGTLPDPDGGVTVVSRKEQWLSTRGTTTAFDLAVGEPPTGFRFLVTPRF